jgi:hypothetical protein
MLRTSLLFLMALALAPDGLMGQVMMDTSDQSVVLARVRGGDESSAAAFLSQEGRARSSRELDAFADSLVAIAISLREGDPVAMYRAASAASMALLASALRGHLDERTRSLAELGFGPPVPYARAYESLVRIVEGSDEPGTKGGGLRLLIQLPNVGRAIQYLAEVAAGPDRVTAYEAVYLLGYQTGQMGLARLRRLYNTDAVVEPVARELINSTAIRLGWER